MFDTLLSAFLYTLIGLFSSFIMYKLATEYRMRFVSRLFLLTLTMTFVAIYGLGEFIWTEWINPPKSGQDLRRQQILTWAKSIVSYENRVNVEMTEFYNLNVIFSRRDLTEAEISRLDTCQQNVLAISKEARNQVVPSKVSKTHELMIDYYTKTYELLFNYNQGMKYIDEDYFNKATSLSKEIENIGNITYDQFAQLLKEFNISCTEINFCE